MGIITIGASEMVPLCRRVSKTWCLHYYETLAGKCYFEKRRYFGIMHCFDLDLIPHLQPR